MAVFSQVVSGYSWVLGIITNSINFISAKEKGEPDSTFHGNHCGADIVNLTDEELEFINGETGLGKRSDMIVKYVPRIVIVTRGSRPCFYNDGGAAFEVPAYEVAAFIKREMREVPGTQYLIAGFKPAPMMASLELPGW